MERKRTDTGDDVGNKEQCASSAIHPSAEIQMSMTTAHGYLSAIIAKRIFANTAASNVLGHLQHQCVTSA